jgi:uncharacterized protein YhbP (UPF0306 family)
MSDYHNKRAAEIINQILYITIASANRDGKPWNSPVYSAFDEHLNFYWSSDKASVHSQNVRENSNVFLVIYDSTMPAGTGEAVYIEAEAIELTDVDEIQVARRTTQSREEKPAGEKEFEKFTSDAIRRIYRASPHRVWMNDVEEDYNGNYIKDIRIEIPLEILKAQVAPL